MLRHRDYLFSLTNQEGDSTHEVVTKSIISLVFVFFVFK